ncbi:MAG: hypothetical protein ACI82N_001248, partial [Maricaulis sp.]
MLVFSGKRSGDDLHRQPLCDQGGLVAALDFD